MLRFWRACLVPLVLAACGDHFGPAPLPAGAVPYGAPASYLRWWQDVERCAGRSAAFDRVRWFVVPGADTFVADGRRVEGVWIEHYRYIVVAEPFMTDSLLVRHEMLHDVLNRVDHPAVYFGEACRGVVRP